MKTILNINKKVLIQEAVVLLEGKKELEIGKEEAKVDDKFNPTNSSSRYNDADIQDELKEMRNLKQDAKIMVDKIGDTMDFIKDSKVIPK